MSNCLIRFPLRFQYLQGIATATRTDVTDLCEIDRLCSGLKGGAFHAMKEICDFVTRTLPLLGVFTC